MACTSLTALPRACGSEGVLAGVDKIYMLAYTDLDTTAGAGYTAAANGMISAITLDATKKFVAVGLLRGTASVAESGTVNVQNGSSFMSQTLTFPVSGLSVENRQFVESVLNQPVIALVKTRAGNHYVLGLNGYLQLEKFEGGTGTAEGDLSGYTLTFSNTDSKMIPGVESSIIAGLIA